MNITTDYEIVEQPMGIAQLVVRVFINGESCGSQVVLYGKSSDIHEFTRGEIDMAEIRRRWRMVP